MSPRGAASEPERAGVHRSRDPQDVLSRCASLLAAQPVWTNVAATVAATELARGDRRSTYLWVERSGAVSALALASPSLPVCLSECPAGDARALAEALHRSGDDVPGVTGPVAAAQEFAGRWCGLTGDVVRPAMWQGVHVCDEVVRPTGVVGGPYRAGADELDLVLGWTADLTREAGLGAPGVEAVAWSVAADRVWLWTAPTGTGGEPRPVSLAMVRTAPTGMARVGPVFTPREDRRHGYASALTAHVTHRVLASGDRVMLLTDLANPTSNRIYAAIGYRRVGGAVVLQLDRPSTPVG